MRFSLVFSLSFISKFSSSLLPKEWESRRARRRAGSSNVFDERIEIVQAPEQQHTIDKFLRNGAQALSHIPTIFFLV